MNRNSEWQLSFINNRFPQNVLFYVLSDDAAWAQATLENISDNIYVIGTQEKGSSLSLSETDQVGK